ncbi:putative mitochondrial protein, partial [Mucuna pruriens]
MEDTKSMSTLMHPFVVLSKDEEGMIRSLLYLTTSRPDTMFSICLCARFQSNIRESHLKAVKRSFRYLVSTINLSLFYKKTQDFRLDGYYNADYAGDKIERKDYKWRMSLYWTMSCVIGKQEA